MQESIGCGLRAAEDSILRVRNPRLHTTGALAVIQGAALERAMETRAEADPTDNPVTLYRAALGRLDGGKRVGDHTYMHQALVEAQEPAARRIVDAAACAAGLSLQNYNIVRLSRDRPELALLNYPKFFDDPFPALRTSWLVDLTDRRVSRRDFPNQDNPLILHRKELMLPVEHPARATFAELTAALEDYGAFDHPPNMIGRRVYWKRALDVLGIIVEGHTALLADREAHEAGRRLNSGQVARHRTAISRSRLSAPMQSLLRWGFIGDATTVLDYGCGRGDDVRTLAAAGVRAVGWDPHFAPDAALQPADVVNLGFVLNVVEDPHERTEALRRAFALTHRVLSVAVMQPGDGRDTRGRGFADGVLTRQGTFQRYFGQSELRDYVSDVLDREPVTVGPGLVFVFRHDQEEQSFLARRQRSAVRSVDASEATAEPRERRRAPRPSAYERHQELLESFWCAALELGRLPEQEEFGRSAEMANAFRSVRRAFEALPFPGKEADLARVAARRADDLLVYLALNLFERRRSAVTLPPSVRRDMTSFLGSRKVAADRARGALFESGSPDHIAAASTRAASEGLGVLAAKDGDYTFHASLLQQQPAALRILLGCAERIEPVPTGVDLLKVHGSEARVSYLRFDDFDGRPLPMLTRRLIVDLRRRRCDETFIQAVTERRVLLGKARLMLPDAPGRDRQERFDAELQRRGVFVQEGLGPNARVLAQRLADAGITLRAAKPAGAPAPQR
jgi:DNA phosphorothioation-associated putative methyltransferase